VFELEEKQNLAEIEELLSKAPSVEAREELVQIGEQAIPALVAILKHDDPNMRGFATETLGKIRSNKAAEALIERFDDTIQIFDYYDSLAAEDLVAPPTVSSLAYEAIVGIGIPAIPSLLRSLDSKKARVAKYSAIALGKIGDDAAVPAILKKIKSSETTIEMVCFSAKALADIGSPKAVAELVHLLHHKEPMVRINGVMALGEIADESAILALLGKLNDETSVTISTPLRSTPEITYNIPQLACESLVRIGAGEVALTTLREMMLAGAKSASECERLIDHTLEFMAVMPKAKPKKLGNSFRDIRDRSQTAEKFMSKQKPEGKGDVSGKDGKSLKRE